MSFENLRINRLIVHRLGLVSHKNPVEPIFSDNLTELNPQGALALQKRLTDALGTDSQCVEVSVKDASEGSAFQKAVKLLHSDKSKFVTFSKELAQKLTDQQRSSNIRPGVAVILSGTAGPTDNHHVSIILKAETDSGFVPEGSQNVVLKYIDNLLLTPHQKLFKIAALKEIRGDTTSNGHRSSDDFEVFVFDHLLSSSLTNEAALYFYKGFLGCDTAPSAKRQTRDFYNLTIDFIKSSSLSEEEKLDQTSNLTAYLRGNKGTLRVKEFADEYLNAQLKDGYFSYMKGKKFPQTAVQKDTKLIKNKLRTRRLRFSSKVRVTWPAEDGEELVKIERADMTGWTTLKIKGDIEERT